MFAVGRGEWCEYCDQAEGRVFIDSWTNTHLCLSCILEIGSRITNSPAEEGDNLPGIIAKHTSEKPE